MTCRRIKKAKITNVDLVVAPANPPSTFVMAKSDGEPDKGIIGKVINMLTGLVGKKQEPEYVEVDAEAGIYDLTLGLCNAFENILEGDRPVSEKKAEVANAISSYKEVISKYLFDAEEIETDDVRATRAARLQGLQDKIGRVVAADRRIELEQTLNKEVEGVDINDVPTANDASIAGAATDGGLENDSTAKAVELGSPSGEEGGGQAGDSEATGLVEGGLHVDSGSVAAGGPWDKDGDGLVGAGSNGDEGAGEQHAALGQTGLENGIAVAPVGAQNDGQPGAELVLANIEKSLQEKIIAYQKRIEEQEDRIAKSKVRMECEKFEAVGWPADEATEVFYALSKTDPAKYDILTKRLEAILQADTIAKGLLSEIGRGNQSGDEVNPADKIETIAKSMAKEKNMSLDQARGQAWMDNPHLFNQYQKMRQLGGK